MPDGDFSGRIAELHARACLVALDDGGLLTLVAPALGSLPYGIVLDLPTGSVAPFAVQLGGKVAVRGGMLRLAGGTLTVDLRRARAWRSNLGALQLDLGKASSRLACEVAVSILREDGRADHLRRIAAGPIAALTAASRARNAERAETAICGLLGLGEGRTPSGDDYLVGYVAGLQAAARAPPAFVVALRAGLKALSAQTTRVSSHYLQAAADGEISERLHAVAAAIADGAAPDAIRAVVARALQVGHSSGAAGVLGLLHACADAGSGDSAVLGCWRSAAARQIAPSIV